MSFTGQDMIDSHLRGENIGYEKGLKEGEEIALKRFKKSNQNYKVFFTTTILGFVVFSVLATAGMRQVVHEMEYADKTITELRSRLSLEYENNKVMERQLVEQVWGTETSMCSDPEKEGDYTKALNDLGLPTDSVVTIPGREWMRL